jgi:hypothetical protein
VVAQGCLSPVGAVTGWSRASGRPLGGEDLGRLFLQRYSDGGIGKVDGAVGDAPPPTGFVWPVREPGGALTAGSQDKRIEIFPDENRQNLQFCRFLVVINTKKHRI